MFLYVHYYLRSDQNIFETWFLRVLKYPNSCDLLSIFKLQKEMRNVKFMGSSSFGQIIGVFNSIPFLSPRSK